MKTLLLTPTTIDRDSGGGLRSSNIRDALAQAGAVDTVVVLGGQAEYRDSVWQPGQIKRAHFTDYGHTLHAWQQRQRIRRWLRGILAAEDYDVIVARYLSMALLLPASVRARLIIDADDAIKSGPPGVDIALTDRLRLWVRNRLALRAVQRAAHVWFVNPHDGPRLNATRSSWLRNVVALPVLPSARPAPEPQRILMVGLYKHPPNADGLRWFAAQVLPALRTTCPQVELHAIGSYYHGFEREFEGQPVRLRGFVASLAAEYAAASLVIAPIHAGGGTQIKVIEALAHARPVVVSAFSHAGFAGELRGGEHLRVGQDAAQWVAHCRWVLQQRDEAEAMALRGREAVVPYGDEGFAAAVRRDLDVVRRGDSAGEAMTHGAQARVHHGVDEGCVGHRPDDRHEQHQPRLA